MIVPCAVSPTDGSGLPASCFNGECYSTPTMVRRQRRRSQRSLSSTGTDIPSSRPTFGKAPRASAVRDAAQRHWHKPARNVLGRGSTVLRSTGREGAPHDSKRRRFVKHSNLITGRKSYLKDAHDADLIAEVLGCGRSSCLSGPARIRLLEHMRAADMRDVIRGGAQALHD